VWLPWQIAVLLAIGLAGVSYLPQPSKLKPIAREAAIILALYALWIRAGEFEPFGVKGGMDRGLQVWKAQRWLHLPSEVWIQKQILPHGWLVQASNIYYAAAHVPAAIAMLVFLFFRHRQHYRVVRTTLAGVTAVSLFMHYTPVAPPRLFPELGFVDTAIKYNQSVYGDFGAGVSTQLAAMPSLHVAWAVLVGVAVFVLEKTRWRWVAVAHTLLTIFVVTDTANHWWLDGVVGSALLVPAFFIARFIHRPRKVTQSEPTASLLVESGQTAR
jgi:PAP2 superfamily